MARYYWNGNLGIVMKYLILLVFTAMLVIASLLISPPLLAGLVCFWIGVLYAEL